MKRLAAILSIAVLAGVASFLTTRAASPASSPAPATAPLDRWLATTPQQQQKIREVDASFQQDVQTLDQKIIAEREKLASMVCTAGVTEVQAAAQVDRLADLQRDLQKRVVSHLLRIRPVLTAGQQQQLASLYGNCLRNGGGGLGRGGAGRGPGPHGYGFGRARGVTPPAGGGE